MSETFLITGASGALGQGVLTELLAAGVEPERIIATTRSPEKLATLQDRGVRVRRATFDEPTSLEQAFSGATRALLISTDSLAEPGQRAKQHQDAVRALEAAGVTHVVYTSIIDPTGSPVTIADSHAATEAALERSKLDYTILRNSLYADLLLQSVAGALESGELIDAKADGRTAYVTRDDCAAVAARALLESTPGRRTLDVTGAEAITGAELAALVTELTGKAVRHVSIPAEALTRALIEHGLPDFIAEMLTSFDVAIARGDFAKPSTTVEELTGRAPQSVRSFLAANLRR